MVEAGAREVPEDVMVEALLFGHNEIKKLCRLQKDMYQKLGITKREVVKPELDQPMMSEIEGLNCRGLARCARPQQSTGNLKAIRWLTS